MTATCLHDTRPRRAQFPIAEALCWNGLTHSQQERLSLQGIIMPGDYGGGECPNRAEIEVKIGDMPGPRFYCRACAALIPK